MSVIHCVYLCFQVFYEFLTDPSVPKLTLDQIDQVTILASLGQLFCCEESEILS